MRTGRVALAVAVLVLLAISVLPLGRTLAESFLVRDTNGRVAQVTTGHYTRLFGGGNEAAPAAQNTPSTRPASVRWRMLGNSAAIALVASLLAVVAGVPYAVLVARTDVPFRRVLGTLYAAPLVLPPLLVGIAWSFLPAFSPPSATSPAHASAWDAPLAILRAATLFSLCYFPLVVLLTSRAVSRVPPALEESARLVGGPWRALRSVTLPLALPAVLASALFVFLFTLEDFALVDFLNWIRPVGQQVSVYPFESFTAWSQKNGEGIATALGVPLLAIGVAGLLVVHRLVVRDGRATIAGDFRPAAPWRLGRGRWPAAIAAFALLAVAAGVPVAGFLAKAAEHVPRPGTHDEGPYRAAWKLVVGEESTSHHLAWTLWYAVAAAAIALPIAWVLAHHAARAGRVWPLVLAFLPLALPPVFLGAGSLRIYESLSIPMADGARNPFMDVDSPRLGAVLLLVAKYVPFAVAVLWAAFLSVDPRLEEAAASAGVRPLDRSLRVLAPLVKPAIALAIVLVFVFSLREIDTIVLLQSETVMRKIYTMVHFQRDSQVAALCLLLLVLEALPFVFLGLLLPRAAGAAEERRTA